MDRIDQLLETLPDDVGVLKAEGFDGAILGYEESTYRLIYSVNKCIEILEEEGMTTEDALDHFYYNVQGSYVGEQTPIWCNDLY
jgi:hypothetical protein